MGRTSEKPHGTEALIRRIEASRARLGTQVGEMRYRFNVPARVGRAVGRNPLAWFGGSVGVGFVANRLLRRRRKKKRWGNVFGLLLTTSLGLLKPKIKQVITSEIQRRLMGHAGPQRTSRERQFPLSKS